MVQIIIVLVNNSDDTTQTGHILGDPQSRTGPVASERCLSPSSVCIVRALMHSAFLWCACHYKDMFEAAINRLIKPTFDPKFFPEFFWLHLVQDIHQLSRATGKSIQDSALIIHLLLHDILTRAQPTCKYSCIVISPSVLYISSS